MNDKGDLAVENGSVEPVVRTGSASNRGVWIFAIALLVGGYALFTSIRNGAEEQQDSALTVEGATDTSGRIFAPPPLVVPASTQQRSFREVRAPPEQPTAFARALETMPTQRSPIPANEQTLRIESMPEPRLTDTSPLQQPERVRPSVVFEQSQRSEPSPVLDMEDGSQDRVRASRLVNPSTTVPMGSVIPAVLETAFDSTRPGAVRALVQRDIHSFDGSRVLIPRGSRLYGTYGAGIVPGEKRALINWNRLLRPDGVIINLNSPASDPLGRAGVEGDVDSRFFARFGGAILQSVLDIGVGIATRQASDGVIVALPGSTQNVSQAAQSQQQPRPVLKIDHGTSVSVFVARDLDFSSVEL